MVVFVFGAGSVFFAEVFLEAEFNSGKIGRKTRDDTLCVVFFSPGEKQMLDLALVLGHDVS